jgi:CSLREA domain-containing protein
MLALASVAQAKPGHSLVVNTLSDTSLPGDSCIGSLRCTLREAINQGNVDAALNPAFPDLIIFQQNLVGTILLQGSLTINQSMTIQGPGAYLLTVSNQNNSAYPGSVFFLQSAGATVNISGLTITGGNADYGGAFQMASTYLTVVNCNITNNYAYDGGGIFASFGSLTIVGTTISGNAAYSSFPTDTITNNAGAIESWYEPTTIVNSTIAGNTAEGAGGAIYMLGGAGTTLTLINSTMTRNSAGVSGGGIEINALGLPLPVTINNSIVSGNTTGGVANSSDCDLCGTQPANNLIGGPPPSLGPLQWNGGFLETVMPLPGSTALCGGLGSAALDQNSNPLASDERGFLLSTAGCGSGKVDLGAVQTHYLTVTSLSGGTHTTPNCTSGTGTTCSLADAIGASNSYGSGDIVFTPSLFPAHTPKTISLTAALPVLGAATTVDIAGPGENALTISGANTFGPIFAFDTGNIGNLLGLTIANGLFSGSSYFPSDATSSGGAGIYNLGTLTVSNSAVSNNSAAGAYYAGGGILNDVNESVLPVVLASMLLNNVTVSGNSDGGPNGFGGFNGFGGGIYNDGNLVLANSTVSGNSVPDTALGGGGIFVDGLGAVAMTNSTVTGNTASDGAGIMSYSNLAVYDSTVSGNTAYNDDGGDGGGGIDSRISGTGDLGATWNVLANSIVAGNTNNGSPDCVNCASGSAYNTIDSVSMTTGNPQLAPLALNGTGALVQTMLPMPGSPAIEAGSLASLPWGVTTDERGFPRLSGAFLDLGAAQTGYSGLQFVQQPTDTVINQNISPAPTVELLETNPNLPGPNNIDGVNGIPITLAFSGTGSIVTPANLTATSTGGVATYSGLAVNAVGTGDTLSASVTVTPAGAATTITLSTVSSAFKIKPLVSVSQLAFLSPPPTPVTAGGNAGTSVQVEEQDSTGTLTSSATDTITLTVTGPGSYSATYTVAAVSGVATFNLSAVQLTLAGNYTYTATLSGVTPAAAAEVVVAAAANSVSVKSGSAQSTPIGTAFANPLAVTVTDLYGNPVSGASVAYHAPGTGASATFTGSPATTAANGTAGVTATANGIASATAYTVTASVTGVGTPASFSLTNTQAATSLTVGPSATALNYGQPVTVSAAITPASVLGSVPGGTVTFYDGAATLTPASTVSGAAASYVVSLPSVGTHNYAAQYSGDSNFLASSKTSAASALVVSKASTTTTVKSSNASITPGQSVTFTATITPQYAGAPTGNVTFYDGGTALGNGTVSGTAATFTTSALTPGLTHSIYATYNGDGNFTPSTSSTINETVAPLDFTLANGADVTQSVPPGSTASFPFALAPVYGSYAGTVSFTSTGAPTGATVTFSPATVPATGGAQTITMNVQTLPATSMLRVPRRGLGSLALGLLAWFGLRRVRRRGRALLWTLVLLAGGAAASLISGCGGGGINGFFAQQPQNYAITMTATSGGIQHSASVTLNVQ